MIAAILWRALPYLLALIVSGFAFWKAEHWCNSVCKDARAEAAVQKDKASTFSERLAELDRQRIKQQEEWASATAAEEQRAKSNAASREGAFAPIRKRVLVDPVVAAAVLPPVLAGVLSDAYAAAEPTRPAEVATDTPKTNPSAAAWLVDTLAWEAECRDRVTAWERWYGSLRDGNLRTPDAQPAP